MRAWSHDNRFDLRLFDTILLQLYLAALTILGASAAVCLILNDSGTTGILDLRMLRA